MIMSDPVRFLNYYASAAPFPPPVPLRTGCRSGVAGVSGGPMPNEEGIIALRPHVPINKAECAVRIMAGFAASRGAAPGADTMAQLAVLWTNALIKALEDEEAK